MTDSHKPRVRKQLTPWQKIIRAGEHGTGTHLTAEDCWRLHFDQAIITRAERDDYPDEDEEDDRVQHDLRTPDREDP
jgi:hypothetical protein